ncbi:hypothetical protein JQM64_00355 [Fournierella massiliensis]|nr:hypothetical protein [Fournierella massiliensis]MCF2556002.1 hypothetical protein [Fournierella massiliensis]
MKTIENHVLQLAEDIYAGRCSYQKAEIRIQSLEKEFEAVDRDIAYPAFPDIVTKDYLDELIGRVRVGLYSKQLLLDLAKASDMLHATKGKHIDIKKPVIAGIAIAAALIIAIIIAVGIGE